MSEKKLQGEMATGLNPHYRPPIMRWNRVELVAEPGHSFGIRHDEMGCLTVLVRPPGKEWPFGMEPTAGGVNTIEDGARSYEVWNDDRGPVRDHDAEPVGDDPSRCRICEERKASPSKADEDLQPLDVKCGVPTDVESLFADLRNLDLPRDENAFDKLKCEVQHGRRIGWYYKADEDYHREWQGDDPRESPPYSGLMVCTPGQEMRGGADTDLDHDRCVVIVEHFPTEKCYPDAAWVALGRLLDADDLVEVFAIEKD